MAMAERHGDVETCQCFDVDGLCNQQLLQQAPLVPFGDLLLQVLVVAVVYLYGCSLEGTRDDVMMKHRTFVSRFYYFFLEGLVVDLQVFVDCQRVVAVHQQVLVVLLVSD